MISIGQEIRMAEQREMERQELLSLYVTALNLPAKHAPNTPGRETFVAEVERLCDGVTRDSSSEALQRSLTEFERYLGEYCASLEGSMKQRFSGGAEQIREVLALLKEAAGTLESSNEQIDADVREFTHQLEETLDFEDLTTIREHLSDHVRRMKKWAETLSEASSVQLIALEKQLRTYELRLKEVESNAVTDALTGLWNRREAERRLQESVDRGAAFSLIVVDLNKFKSINDRYGHRCGDRVLRYVADRLLRLVRSQDRVCRWGGDEFIVLMDLEPSSGERRSAELAEQMRGLASLEFDGQKLQLAVSAAVGWAAYEPGDTAASLFQRADLDMYKNKKRAELEPQKAVVYAF